MTIKERAEDLKLELAEADFGGYLPKDVVPIIERAIIAAVESEREACAQIADWIARGFVTPGAEDAARAIADRIRARGEEKKGEG